MEGASLRPDLQSRVLGFDVQQYIVLFCAKLSYVITVSGMQVLLAFIDALNCSLVVQLSDRVAELSGSKARS